MTRTPLPQPADGFTYPLSIEQQMRRVNRAAHVLWDHRRHIEGVSRDGVRVAVEVLPDRDAAQIEFHVHVPGTVDDGRALMVALGGDPDNHERRLYGKAHHHDWYGTLDGFRFRVALVEPLALAAAERVDQLTALARQGATGSGMAAAGPLSEGPGQ